MQPAACCREALLCRRQLAAAGARIEQALLDEVAQQEAAVLEKGVLQHAVGDEMDELVVQCRYSDDGMPSC